jgi:asparagine synthetase B (glutamine-hydrolysing)
VCGITGWVDFERDLTGCLPRLNGMFTFAVWDSASQELVLARDRLGVKPLSFAQTAYGTLFGSEPKAILAHPQWRAELDAEGMAAAAFLLDVNEWLTEYRVSLV